MVVASSCICITCYSMCRSCISFHRSQRPCALCSDHVVYVTRTHRESRVVPISLPALGLVLVGIKGTLIVETCVSVFSIVHAVETNVGVLLSP
ncbi:unnamed protein product [Danaus chrysippus]|uniref:(African queen) hypothetical protein n=1 Tax=Danaus chrysippus TaxID=151541 RepID=A0A8J2VZG5_9NEOP|nr:unnamed protein product [Danaus chrysippus]